MSATDAVLQNAAYHAQLLAQIAELDYVPPALKQQDDYIAGLQNDLTVLARQITALEAKTKKERKEHEALRDSTTRRFAAKITGRKEKFEAKASKEEREYIEALEKEMQHKRQRETLETMIAEAKAVRADLQDKLKVYNKTKDDLAALYSKIFDGPTQAYPEDDQLEYTLQQAQTRYNEIQGFLNRESQAVNLLQSANNALLACSSKMQEALSYSQWDMFGGGAMSDMMERNALSSAEGYATQAQIFVQQAMMASPQVLPIGEINIAHGSIMSDVIFDNIFTDMAFHDKIKNSARNVQAVQFNLTNQLALARSRAGAIGADLNQAAEALTRARGTLDAFRRSVFDNLSGGGGAGGPPAYTYTAPAGPPPGQQRDMQQEPVMMPRGPEETTSSYTPPASSTSPPPPQLQPTGSYAPPPGPPPAADSAS
ncbi:hypothetical protein MVEN_00315100 [Mycena venus]|uniref:Uncharacterized protein n=1 Tax=Mycena venus TaxID=2733690 RepID=A0A8H7DEA4_9AGAR|nr:hypothetical protein MVEN_00315100 [Mycena venus]